MSKNGFTLLEVLISVILLTMLALIATPSLNQTYRNWQFNNEFRILIADLSLTRHTAISHNQRVIMQPLDQWEDGWVVFIDTNDNQQFDASDIFIKQAQPLTHSRVKTAKTLQKYISYAGSGEARFVSSKSPGGMMIGNLLICPNNAHSPNKKIIIAKGGRIRTQINSTRQCD